MSNLFKFQLYIWTLLTLIIQVVGHDSKLTLVSGLIYLLAFTVRPWIWHKFFLRSEAVEAKHNDASDFIFLGTRLPHDHEHEETQSFLRYWIEGYGFLRFIVSAIVLNGIYFYLISQIHLKIVGFSLILLLGAPTLILCIIYYEHFLLIPLVCSFVFILNFNRLSHPKLALLGFLFIIFSIFIFYSWSRPKPKDQKISYKSSSLFFSLLVVSVFWFFDSLIPDAKRQIGIKQTLSKKIAKEIVKRLPVNLPSSAKSVGLSPAESKELKNILSAGSGLGSGTGSGEGSGTGADSVAGMSGSLGVGSGADIGSAGQIRGKNPGDSFEQSKNHISLSEDEEKEITELIRKISNTQQSVSHTKDGFAKLEARPGSDNGVVSDSVSSDGRSDRGSDISGSGGGGDIGGDQGGPGSESIGAMSNFSQDKNNQKSRSILDEEYNQKAYDRLKELAQKTSPQEFKKVLEKSGIDKNKLNQFQDISQKSDKSDQKQLSTNNKIASADAKQDLAEEDRLHDLGQKMTEDDWKSLSQDEVSRLQKKMPSSHPPLESFGKTKESDKIMAKRKELEKKFELHIQTLSKLIIFILVGCGILALYEFIRRYRKPGVIKDVEDEKKSKLDKEKLVNEYRKIVKKRLTPEEEVVKTYNIFLELMDGKDIGKPQHLPTTEYTENLIKKIPNMQTDLNFLNEVFCDTLFAKKNPAENIKLFRQSFIRIANHAMQ